MKATQLHSNSSSSSFSLCVARLCVLRARESDLGKEMGRFSCLRLGSSSSYNFVLFWFFD
jgi:hypothetical protein